MLNLPFNPALPSALTAERINELNALALKAQINKEGSISDDKVNESCLVIEACGMQEVYSSLCDFDMFTSFYNDIDEAFTLLLEKRPDDIKNTFGTYTSLSDLFRTIAKQLAFIERRLCEVNEILSDLNILDEESLNRGKGGNSDD